VTSSPEPTLGDVDDARSDSAVGFSHRGDGRNDNLDERGGRPDTEDQDRREYAG
jgi:hypothetical protein